MVIAANTKIKNQDIPGNSWVFGESPSLIIKEQNEDYINNFNIWNP